MPTGTVGESGGQAAVACAARRQQSALLEHLIASPRLGVDLMIQCSRVLVPRFADLGRPLPHLEHLARVDIAGVLSEPADLRDRVDAA